MIVFNFIFALLYCGCILKADCFFQLNGYKGGKGYFSYFKTEFFAYSFVSFALSVLCYILFFNVWRYVHCVLLVMLCLVYPLEHKKTPLHFTNRIKRLSITQFFVLLGLSFTFNPVVIVLLPFVVLFANAINMPFELSINASFINKAKLKLKQYPNLKIIAVTGSYGKTSVKNILTTLLQQKFNVVKTPANFNTTLGIVKTINNTDFTDVDFFVCEMGARRQGDIKEICQIAPPDICILTGIAPQHLDTFGNIQNIIDTKTEVIKYAKKDAIVFLNGDSLYLKNLQSTNKQTFFTGKYDNCYCFYTDETVNEKGSVFTLNFKDEKCFCTTKLLGLHNVSNICLSCAVAYFLGLNTNELQQGVQSLQFSPHRLELIKGKNGIYILDDSYNANIEGVKQSLEVLKTFCGHKFVIVCGIVEAGKQTKMLNGKIGNMLANVCDGVALVGPNSDDIKVGLDDKSFDANKIFVCDNVQDAVQKIVKLAVCGDVILFSNDLPDNII